MLYVHILGHDSVSAVLVLTKMLCLPKKDTKDRWFITLLMSVLLVWQMCTDVGLCLCFSCWSLFIFRRIGKTNNVSFLSKCYLNLEAIMWSFLLLNLSLKTFSVPSLIFTFQSKRPVGSLHIPTGLKYASYWFSLETKPRWRYTKSGVYWHWIIAWKTINADGYNVRTHG